ncbi:MAG: CehA/McbA family metallohydrolase [Clostridia bacterium]|nr:CehA/McbA family metallohydrolase [Clostridia bacterium]
MGIMLNEAYPKVVAANRRHRMCFQLCGQDLETGTPEAKVQPMERYTVGHAPDYLSHHEDRYPWVPLTHQGDGLYCAEFDFAGEQRYSVKVRLGDNLFYAGYAYAVEPDLAALRPYKGDTHLHTNCSDGWESPFDTVCAYRAAGYNFIAITDHGRYYPSVDTRAEISGLTDAFHIMLGEEVHPKGGSYFHIVSLGARRAVSPVLEQQHDYVAAQIEAVMAERDLTALPDPYAAAFRTFVAAEIRRAGGVAVMAHPFWESGGEYNYQTEEFLYHWRSGDFDALELLAGCDDTGNGNNLQDILWNDLRAEGYRIPVVGASDAHVPRDRCDYDHFNHQFTLVLATGYDDLTRAIMEGRAVAVDRRDDKFFRCLGTYRYAKYARHLMREYYGPYTALAAVHAEALAARDKEALSAVEADIAAFDKKFYAV